MRILVIGCGSIGKRHLKNLASLSAGKFMAYDTDEGRRNEVEQELNIETVSDIGKAWGQDIDAVLVCTPTSHHMEYALEAVRSGRHLFIEKPISHNLEGVDELIETAASKGLIVMVGCNFRFHWGMELAKRLADEGTIGRILSAHADFGQYLPDWHPYEDYRRGYSANEGLGGGIILDAIHEIDYVLWLMANPTLVSCLSQKTGSLDIDTEDSADINLGFEDGTAASIHMDYLQRAYNRSLKLIGEAGVITWTFQENSVRVYTADDKSWKSYEADKPSETNDMYIAEMRHFLACVEGKQKPMLDAVQAKRDLEVALAAKESARTGRAVRL